MQTLLKEYSQAFRKPAVPQIQSGDTVRVQQLIKEGSKQRVQAFTGTVIRTRQMNQTSANITVRWIASGVGVEKTIPLHSPLIKKIDVTKRGKVRRNYLSYLRQRSGRSARLIDQAFDREAVNVKEEEPQVAAADELDAEVTEIKEDSSVETEGSTEEVAKDENKAASDDEPAAEPTAEGDEAQAPADEVNEKLDQADTEDTSAQE